MGAQEDYKTFEAADLNEAKSKAHTIMDMDRHENGHSYSGTIGMAQGIFFDAHRPVDVNAAVEYTFGTSANGWTDCKVEKWEGAILLQLQDGTWFIGAMCSC